MTISQLLFYGFLLISIISSLVYAYLIKRYEKGWESLRFKNIDLHSFPKVSVVIACRNEEKTIGRLIEHLISQTYPREEYEIIIVDDFSTDDTLKILENHNDKVKILTSRKPGKKNAMAYGVENAYGEFILTTDADCIVPEKWIESHVSLYLEKKSFLQLGLVDFIANGTIHKILTLEFFSLIGSAAGSAAMGKPVLSNAANIAFSKRIYTELKTTINTTIPSGDDVFLLEEIKKRYPDKIAFLKAKECIVKTTPPQSLIEFFNQRIRWASKNKHYTDKDIISTGIIVLTLNLLTFISLIALFLDKKFAFTYLFLILFKSIVDFGFLIKIATFFNKKNLIYYLPFVQFFYPMYVVIIGLLSFFVKYKWKDRKY